MCVEKEERERKFVFLKRAIAGLIFIYFRSWKTIYWIVTVDFKGIQTPIIMVERKHADHLTTTTATRETVWKRQLLVELL